MPAFTLLVTSCVKQPKGIWSSKTRGRNGRAKPKRNVWIWMSENSLKTTHLGTECCGVINLQS